MAKSKRNPRSDFTSHAVSGTPSDFESERDDFMMKASQLCMEFLFHYTSPPSKCRVKFSGTLIPRQLRTAETHINQSTIDYVSNNESIKFAKVVGKKSFILQEEPATSMFKKGFP